MKNLTAKENAFATIEISISKELWQGLQWLAKKQGVSVCKIMDKAVEDFLDSSEKLDIEKDVVYNIARKGTCRSDSG